jgi:hypothetical protein
MDRGLVTRERADATGYEASAAMLPQVAKFQRGDFPLVLPANPFFKLEMTTFEVSADMPHEVGNKLARELSKVAAITKHTRKKFAIVAVSVEQCVSCKLKVRVYDLEGGNYAVEFQRRAGDAILFNEIYRFVRARFGKRDTYMPDPCDPPPFSLDESMCWSDDDAFGGKRERSIECDKGPRVLKLARL